MREDLADWSDWDMAALSYGAAIGVFDDASRRQVRRVVLSDNDLGSGLHDGVMALVTAGVLERREQPEEQFRWVFAGPKSLPGALESWGADAKPLALDLPGIGNADDDAAPQNGERRRWWSPRRG